MESIQISDLVNPYTIAILAMGLSNFAIWMVGDQVSWTPQKKVALGSGCVLAVFILGIILNSEAYLNSDTPPAQKAFIVLLNALIVLLSSMGVPTIKDTAMMVLGKFSISQETGRQGGMYTSYTATHPQATYEVVDSPKRLRSWTSR